MAGGGGHRTARPTLPGPFRAFRVFRGSPSRASPISKTRNPCPVPPPIKAKTPVIVLNQGSSRQTPFFQIALPSANPPAGWVGPVGEWSNRAPRKIPLLGERIKVRASVTTNLALCVKTYSPPQSRQKPQQSRLIVPYQGKSRQTPNSRSASLIGRSNTQTRQPLHSGCRPAPIRPQQPIKAKNPLIVHDQGTSRHPQKNTRILGRLLLGASLGLGRWNLELPCPIPCHVPQAGGGAVFGRG